MANVTRVLPLLLLCSVYVAHCMLDGKALYCKDPDTGKLHSINSTWSSTSFCGNYSCKLKKRNITETVYAPIVQYNKSTLISSYNKTENKADLKEESTSVLIAKKKEADIQLSKLNLNLIPQNTENDPNNDRYLTESEIKSISEMLHTVKKSDLDAIVEIYNLAQDIYQEIDKETSNNNTVDVMKNEKSELNEIKTLPNAKSTSYWYEPLNLNTQKAARSIDMEHQGSNSVPSAVAYKRDPKQLYYSNPLLNTDYGKLPYYYPLSNFQRMSSYVHQMPTSNPCSQTNEHALINKVLKRQEQKLIQPSVLLPYPFSYVHNFNTSYLNNYYYNPNLWSYYDYYKYRNYQPYTHQTPNNTVFTNTQDVEKNSVSKEENDILDDLIAKAKNTNLPDWQTAPIPEHVLQEVRANIEKSPLLPLRLPFMKKINLEKVGKLIKLDEFSRSKRDANSKLEKETIIEDEGLYESFLESITCPPDTQVGYFRRGNLSKAYPECCPQKIDKPAVSNQYEETSQN